MLFNGWTYSLSRTTQLSISQFTLQNFRLIWFFWVKVLTRCTTMSASFLIFDCSFWSARTYLWRHDRLGRKLMSQVLFDHSLVRILTVSCLVSFQLSHPELLQIYRVYDVANVLKIFHTPVIVDVNHCQFKIKFLGHMLLIICIENFDFDRKPILKIFETFRGLLNLSNAPNFLYAHWIFESQCL